jgi:hypothetical protein
MKTRVCNRVMALLGLAALAACSTKKHAPHKEYPLPYAGAGHESCDRWIASMLACAEANPQRRGDVLAELRSQVDSMATGVVDSDRRTETLGAVCPDTDHETVLQQLGCVPSDDLSQVVAAGNNVAPAPIGVPACDAYVASQRACIHGTVAQELRAAFHDERAAIYEKEMIYYLNIQSDLFRRGARSTPKYDVATVCQDLASIAKSHGGCRE